MTLMDLPELRVAVSRGFAMDAQSRNALIASLLPLSYNAAHSVRLKLSKFYPLEGATQWHTELDYVGSIPFAPSTTGQPPGVVDEAFEAYFASAPGFYAELLRDPNLELNASAPNATRRFYMETCFSPMSFQVSTVRLSRSYGFVSFLSDVGGFLNLLALTLALLFPFSQVLIKPRSFVGTWLWRNCLCGSTDKLKHDGANSKGQASSVNGMQEANSVVSSDSGAGTQELVPSPLQSHSSSS